MCVSEEHEPVTFGGYVWELTMIQMLDQLYCCAGSSSTSPSGVDMSQSFLCLSSESSNLEFRSLGMPLLIHVAEWQQHTACHATLLPETKHLRPPSWHACFDLSSCKQTPTSTLPTFRTTPSTAVSICKLSGTTRFVSARMLLPKIPMHACW